MSTRAAHGHCLWSAYTRRHANANRRASGISGHTRERGRGAGVPAHTMYCENSSMNWEKTAAAHLRVYVMQSALYIAHSEELTPETVYPVSTQLRRITRRNSPYMRY